MNITIKNSLEQEAFFKYCREKSFSWQSVIPSSGSREEAVSVELISRHVTYIVESLKSFRVWDRGCSVENDSSAHKAA